jgi:hypothetical protein
MRPDIEILLSNVPIVYYLCVRVNDLEILKVKMAGLTCHYILLAYFN